MFWNISIGIRIILLGEVQKDVKKKRQLHKTFLPEGIETKRQINLPITPHRADKKVAKLSLSQEFLNYLGRILESISYFLRIS